MDQMIVRARTLDVHEACVAEVRRGLGRLHKLRCRRQGGRRHLGHSARIARLSPPWPTA